jgi:hypothetical protein
MKLFKYFKVALLIFVLSSILAIVVSSRFDLVSRADGGTEVVTGNVSGPSGNLDNVTVIATDPGGTNVDFGPVTTDSSGNYTLDVNAGTYDFHFVPPSSTGLSAIIDSSVTVDSNQAINARLTLATYTFSGTITDQNNNPIPNLHVQCAGDAGVTTNSSGYFSATVPAGICNVYISNSGTNNITIDGGKLSSFEFDALTTVDLTNGNATKNFTINLAPLTVTAKDNSGNPVSGASVYVINSSGGTTVVNSGSDSYTTGDSSAFGSSSNYPPIELLTGTDGTATAIVPQGASWDANNVCVVFADHTAACNSSPVTVTSPTSLIFQQGSGEVFVPTPPTNLTIPSPTTTPSLTWTASTNATSYNIYANGTFIANTTTTSYIDHSPTIGTDSYYVTALNSAGESSAGTTTQTFYLSINNVQAIPTFVSTNSLTESYGVPFTFTVDTTGDPIPNISKVSGSGSLPSSVTLKDNNDGTATVSGELTKASDSGVYTFTIKATNSNGTATQAFTLTITKTPVISNIATKTAYVGTSYNQTITATGDPIPSLTVTNLPAGLSFTDNGNGTGTITGTPSIGSGSQYTVMVTATNTEGSTTTTYTLSVNEAPTITSTNTATATRGTSFNFQVTAKGYPSPSFNETGTLPKGISFTNSTGVFTGTALTSDTPGNYNVTITAKNSQGTVEQGFVLTLN